MLAAVQRLRARAQQSGNLKSTEQQNVIVEPAPAGAQTSETIVRIEPENPGVIYVPAYNPTVVYGAWSYPTYPAFKAARATEERLHSQPIGLLTEHGRQY